MGIEHYLVCNECKEYIDLHKCYTFYRICNNYRPPKPKDEGKFGSYWDARGLWFLWKHKGCGGVVMHTDCDEEWFDIEPLLKEVFPSEEDF